MGKTLLREGGKKEGDKCRCDFSVGLPSENLNQMTRSFHDSRASHGLPAVVGSVSKLVA